MTKADRKLLTVHKAVPLRREGNRMIWSVTLACVPQHTVTSIVTTHAMCGPVTAIKTALKTAPASALRPEQLK